MHFKPSKIFIYCTSLPQKSNHLPDMRILNRLLGSTSCHLVQYSGSPAVARYHVAKSVKTVKATLQTFHNWAVWPCCCFFGYNLVALHVWKTCLALGLEEAILNLLAFHRLKLAKGLEIFFIHPPAWSTSTFRYSGLSPDLYHSHLVHSEHGCFGVWSRILDDSTEKSRISGRHPRHPLVPRNQLRLPSRFAPPWSTDNGVASSVDRTHLRSPLALSWVAHGVHFQNFDPHSSNPHYPDNST